MNNYLHGCGNDDRHLTLYRLADGFSPIPLLSADYWLIRCGFRPPSKIQNGILLCDVCVAKLGLLAFSDSSDSHASPRLIA